MATRLSPSVVRGLILLLAAAILVALSPAARPTRLSEQLAQARTSLQRGDASAALLALETALRLEPSLRPLHRPAAYAALEARDPAAAVPHIEQAMGAEPHATDLECLRLQALTEAGVLDASDILPGVCLRFAGLRESRARALFAEGEYALALAELESGASTPRDDPEAPRLRAILLAALRPESALQAVIDARQAGGREDPLLADLEAAFRTSIGSSAFDSAMLAGQVFLAHGDVRAAGLCFQRATDLDPADIAARAYHVYASSPTDPQAASRLRTLRAEAPDLPLLYLLEAIVLREGGFPSSALPVLEAALDVDPENPAAWAELGATHLALGEIAQAAQDYRLAAETAISDPAYWRLLARFSLDHGVDPAGLALPAARNAVALDPLDAEAWDLLGEAHLRQGDVWLADRVLRTAIRMDPGSPASHYHFGLVRLALSDPLGARTAFETVLRIDPEGGYADLARRSLETLDG